MFNRLVIYIVFVSMIQNICTPTDIEDTMDKVVDLNSPNIKR